MTVAATTAPRTRPTTRTTSGLTAPMLGRRGPFPAGHGRFPRPEGGLFIRAWPGVHRTRHEYGRERPRVDDGRRLARGRGYEEDDRCGRATARNSTTSAPRWWRWRTRWAPR